MTLEGIILSDIRVGKSEGQNVVYRTYRKNDIIIGNIVNNSDNPFNHSPIFITTDGYRIPLTNIAKTTSRRNSEIYQDADVLENKDFYKKDTIKKAAQMSSNFDASKLMESISKKSKYSVNGAFTGAAAGLIYALYYQKPKMTFVAIGVIVGGFIGNRIHSLINENDSKDTI